MHCKSQSQIGKIKLKQGLTAQAKTVVVVIPTVTDFIDFPNSVFYTNE